MASKIIKGQSQGTGEAASEADLTGKVIEREVLIAYQKARRIVEEAEARARTLVAEATRESEEMVEQARREAETALTEARERAAEVEREATERGWARGLSQWEEKLATFAEESARRMERARPQLMALCLKIGEKLLHRKLEEEPSVIEARVEGALESVRGYHREPLHLHLHPEDLPAVEEFRTRLQARDARWQNLELVADEKLSRGGCRIETSFGTVDATVETQLAAMEELLR